MSSPKQHLSGSPLYHARNHLRDCESHLIAGHRSAVFAGARLDSGARYALAQQLTKHIEGDIAFRRRVTLCIEGDIAASHRTGSN
jgi:hypothetical protein